MKKTYLILFSFFIFKNACFAQLDVPNGGYNAGGPLGNGSWLRFTSGGDPTFIQETWGLNLSGTNIQPVKIINTSLLVGYQSDDNSSAFAPGNALISGKIGIGTILLEARLHLLNSYDTNNGTAIKMFYQGTWGTANYASLYRFLDISSTENGKVLQVNGNGIGVGTDPPLFNSPDKLYVSGNVGIGTIAPDAKLTVKGNVHAQEVKVDLNVPGPDYVFEKNYKIRPLKEVVDYISANNHLPEIPSAKAMAQNGLNLGELNMQMLKKIEELTLYLIEKDAQVQNLQKQVAGLDRRLRAVAVKRNTK